MTLDLSIVGQPTAPSFFSYTWKDVALYALGIGAKRDELDYLYEGRGPKVYPSFAVVPKFGPMIETLKRSGGDYSMVVHGAERVEIFRPFAPSGTLRTVVTIRGVYDMRRFASVLVDADTHDEAGVLLARTTSTIFFRGEGGFGGDAPPKSARVNTVPKDRPADFTIEEKTTEEQALLYRLSGDDNPLHVDPVFAAGVGFEQGPILHGLGTLGIMVRHVAKGACGGDGTKILAFEATFRKPVWPGETLVTQGWEVGAGNIALQVKAKERDEVVLGGAWANAAPNESANCSQTAAVIPRADV